MIRKLACLALVSGASAQIAYSHDFWIEPPTYEVEAGDVVPLSIFTGHGEDKANWPYESHRIIGLRSTGPAGLESHMSGDTGGPSVRLTREGLHMVFIESTNSYSRLPAEKFDAYVEEEGILPIAAARLIDGDASADGTELYSRRGKALIKVGCDGIEDQSWSRPLGLTLEIIPLSNPFDWDAGDSLGVEVRFHGQPIGSATLHVSELGEDGKSFTTKTGSDGRVDLSADLTEGRWLVHTVWSQKAENLLAGADYQTVFSSLTFETETDCG